MSHHKSIGNASKFLRSALTKLASNRVVNTAFRLTVTTVIIVLLLTNIDIREFIKEIDGISLDLILIIFIAFLVNNFLSAIRWKLILSSLGVNETLSKVFLIYFISFFWSSFLPSTIGGDGYRFFAMRKGRDETNAKIISSILLDRGIGLIGLLLLHFLLAGMFLKIIITTPILLWIELGGILGVIGIVLSWANIEVLLRLPVINNFYKKLREILRLLRIQNLKIVSLAIALTLVFNLISGWAWVMYYSAAGASPAIQLILYASTLSNLLGMIPITINGIGLVEFAQVIIVGSQNVPKEIIIEAAIYLRVMGIIIATISGLAYLVNGLVIRQTNSNTSVSNGPDKK